MYKDKKNRKNKRNILSIAAAIGLTIIFAGVGVKIFGISEKEAEENNKSFFVSAELNKHMTGFEGGIFDTETKETEAKYLEGKTEGAVNSFLDKEETEREGSKDKAEQTREENAKDNAEKAGEEASEGKTEETKDENIANKTEEAGEQTFGNKQDEVSQESSEGKAEENGQENSVENTGQENFEEGTENANQTEPPAPEISESQTNQNFVSDTEYTFTDAPEGYFEDALFIGDSRTVNLEEYGNLEGADFFAVVGMSVYNITKQRVDVAGEKNIDIETLLSHHSYGKIYFMLGLNELGYNRQKTVDRYRAWIEYIQQMQPQAIIFIEANLHVTAKKSAEDEECRNEDIDEFNNYTKELADNRTIFYVDVNELFDDEGGNLCADLTYDGVHILAKYYKDWGAWLRKKAVVR